MEIGGCREIDLDFEAHDLIDNSRFSEAVSAKKEVNFSPGINVSNDLPELNESTEPEQNERNGRYNLRKSLAWDSAFFTSAGVLDPEELSSMITGAEKSAKPSLPGIQEEITGSTDSLSTLASDSLTLEACEDDLFVDIRASIQRSNKKASDFINSSSKTAAKEIDSTAISYLKKEDSVSQDKNPKPCLKKTSGFQPLRMSRCQPKQIGKLASGKSIKQDSVHSRVTQAASIAKIGEANSIVSKPSKTISSSIPSTAAAKRESMGTGRVKSESGSSKLGTVTSKGTQPSKVSVLSGSRKALPKHGVPSKGTLSGSSTTSSVHSARSSTSSDSSIKTSSGIPPKSTLMTARRNLGKSSNTGIGPSGSISKTPSKAMPKNKLPASTLSAYLMSAKTSNVSPASSISEWSSTSSSSSMLNQRSNNSRTSLDATSCKSMDGDSAVLDPRDQSAGPTAERRENCGVSLTSNTSKRSSTQAGTLQGLTKPTGLRMPSPKIGFFDGVKSPARTPNGPQRSQSGLHTVLPKNGAATSIPSSNNKLKSAKVPTARMVSSLANMKSDSPKAASPASSQEQSHVVNASTVSTDEKDSSSLSLGVKVSATEETCLKAEKVQAEDRVEQVVDAGTGVIDKENIGDLNAYKNMGSGDIKTASGKRSNTSGSENIDQIGDNVLINQDNLKNSRPICETTEKGNDHFVCQGEELTGDNSGISPNGPDKENLGHLSACKNMGSGDIKTASGKRSNTSGSENIDQIGDNILINQDNLKNSRPNCETTEKENGHFVCQGEELTGDNSGVSQNGRYKENLGHLSACKNMGSGDVETALGETSNTSGPEKIDQIGDNVLINQDNLKNSRPICETTKKENDHPECQGERLIGDESSVSPNGHDKENLGDLSAYKNMGSGDVKTGSGERSNTSGSEIIDQIGDNVPINQDNLKNSRPICEATEKENDHPECQREGLTGDKSGVSPNGHRLTYELRSDPSGSAHSSSSAVSESAASRAPFALKNSPGSNECNDMPAAADKAGFLLPSPELKENI